MKLLIVVDYQNDFVDGALGFPNAKLLEDKICSLIEEHDNVIFTFDCHDKDYLNTYEGKALPTVHCIKDTDGYKLYGNVANYLDKAIAKFDKNGFGSLELGNYLREHPEFDEIYLCGLVSNMCVFSNAIMAKAANPYARVIILKDYTDSFDKVLESKAFQALQGLFVEVK